MTTRVLRGRAAGTLAEARQGIREQWAVDPATDEPTPERLARQRHVQWLETLLDCNQQQAMARCEIEARARALRGVA